MHITQVVIRRTVLRISSAFIFSLSLSLAEIFAGNPGPYSSSKEHLEFVVQDFLQPRCCPCHTTNSESTEGISGLRIGIIHWAPTAVDGRTLRCDWCRRRWTTRVVEAAVLRIILDCGCTTWSTACRSSPFSSSSPLEASYSSR